MRGRMWLCTLVNWGALIMGALTGVIENRDLKAGPHECEKEFKRVL